MTIVAVEDTRNAEWAKSTTGFGQKMLSKMGWSDGQGLGKNKQGNNLHLRAIRRTEETQGIGVSIDSTGSNGWSQTNTNFQSILSSLQEKHVIPPKDEKKKKKKNLILAQNKVNAGHSKKMRHAKDLSTKSREDIAAIFGAAPKATAPSIKLFSSNDDDTTTTSKINDIPTVSSDSSAVELKEKKKKDKKKKRKRKLDASIKSNGDECSKKESKKKKKSKK